MITKPVRFSLILTAALISCGFTWGKTDKCAEATNAARNLSMVIHEGERNKEEERIRAVCPGGAADSFIKALRHERKGETEAAIAKYRSVLRADETFSEAHGNLGILLMQTGDLDEASVELTQALMGRPDPRYHRALAELLGGKKLHALAAFHYRQALKSFPDDASARTGLAAAYTGLGDYEHAEKEYKAILRFKPDDERALIDLARVYRKAGRAEDALNVLQQAATHNPKNTDIHRMIGDIYLEKNDHDAARREYALAGIVFLEKPEEFLRRGDDYFAAGDYLNAIAAYKVVAKARPGSPDVYSKMGEAYVASSEYDEAIAAYRKAIDLKGPGEQLHYSLGVLYERKGLLDESAEQYLKALQVAPDNGDARRRLAEIYFLRGSFVQAAEQYKKLIRTRSDNPLLHLKLGNVYEMNKKFPEAIAAYQEAVKLDPDNLKAHKDLAGLLNRRGLHEKAEAQYRQVLRLKKDDEETRLALIALFVKKKKYDDLFLLLKEGTELHPEDPNSHYKLGIINEFRKDFPAAIASYEKTVALDKGHAKGLNALGKLYLKLRRVDEAKKTLEAARLADPELDEPTLLLNRIKHDLAPEPVKVKKKAIKKSKVKKSKVKKAPKKKPVKKKVTKKVTKKAPAKTPSKSRK